MKVYEVSFPVIGSRIQTDHGYSLYSAIKNELELESDFFDGVTLGAVKGSKSNSEQGILRISPTARLTLRTSDFKKAKRLCDRLARKRFTLWKEKKVVNISLGSGRLDFARPSPNLRFKIVIIKSCDSNAELFRSNLEQRLSASGISYSRLEIGRCRKVMVRRCIPGFEVKIFGLDEESSLKLQLGLCQKTSMGAGFAEPIL